MAGLGRSFLAVRILKVWLTDTSGFRVLNWCYPALVLCE